MSELVNGGGGISQSALGKALSLSPPAITKLKKQGMPTTSVEAAREWRARNIRASVTGAPSAPPVPRPERPRAQVFADDEPPDYHEARARREQAEAELAELKLAEQRGDLLRAADVRAAYAKRAAGLREALLQIPMRLAAVLAAETDQARVHDRIQTELHAVLEQMVGA